MKVFLCINSEFDFELDFDPAGKIDLLSELQLLRQTRLANLQRVITNPKMIAKIDKSLAEDEDQVLSVALEQYATLSQRVSEPSVSIYADELKFVQDVLAYKNTKKM